MNQSEHTVVEAVQKMPDYITRLETLKAKRKQIIEKRQKRLRYKIFNLRRKAEEFRKNGNSSEEMVCLLNANFWEAELEILNVGTKSEILLLQSIL